MKPRFVMAAIVLAGLAAPLAAEAQGLIGGAQQGAAVGNRAAGPVGGAVGGVVGGATGMVVGGVTGAIGVPQRAAVRRSAKARAYRVRSAKRR